MELLTALSSLTVRHNDRSLHRSTRSANPGLAAPPYGGRLRHSSCGIRTWCGRPVEPESPQYEPHDSQTRTNKNAALSSRAPVCPGRRPTDLCATALFSFQGTDASAQPISDRITDRTGEARRQSQRGIDYHWLSIMSMLNGPPLSTVSSTTNPVVRPPPAAVRPLLIAHFSECPRTRALQQPSPSLSRGRRRRARRPCARSIWPAKRAADSRNRRPWSRSHSC